MWARSDRRLFVPLLVLLIALAWVVLWLWGRSPYARFLSHHHLEEIRGSGALLLVFVTGWIVMIVAMMLPTSLPLVTLFHTLVHGRAEGTRLVLLLTAGYLSIWTLFGLAVYAADWVLHGAIDRSPWLQSSAWMLGAATLVVAGLYQFTPLKYRCLDKCRSPLSFIIEHWQGGSEHTQAFRLGVHHAIFCVGCCWSLMLLMFAVGIGNLGWMLALGAVMAAEKNFPWGRQLSTPLGAFLLLWGIVLSLLSAPTGTFGI